MSFLRKGNKILLFVYINTHFKEMWRVALLLKRASYTPLVYFVTEYKGYERDIVLCKQEQIEFLTPQEFNAIGVRRKNGIRALTQVIRRWLMYQLKTGLTGIYVQSKNIFFLAKCRKPLSAIKKIVHVILVILKLFFVLSLFLIGALVYLFNLLANLIGLGKLTRYAVPRVQVRIKPGRLERKIFIFASFKLKSYMKSFVKLLAKKLEFPWRIAIKYYPQIWDKYAISATHNIRKAKQISQSWPILLKEYNISLLVLPEHNLFYFTQIISDCCRKKNVPSVIVPFTIANTLEWCESFISSPDHNLNYAINKVFAKKFPHWVITYKNKQLMFPVEHILLNEMMGTTPKVPWLINSGAIDAIAVESQAMFDYYSRAGIEREVMTVTGALYDDAVFSELSNSKESRLRLYEELGFQDISRPMLLMAFPPDQLCSRRDFCDFKTFQEIVSFLLPLLNTAVDRYNVVINLHPRIEKGAFYSIQEFPKIKISNSNIANLIPLSSLYFASCSATIRMAVASGIPVLNYDLHRYYYDDYDSLKGVITVQDQVDLVREFNSLVHDAGYYQMMLEHQQEVSNSWGCIDGRSGQRILGLFEKLLAKKEGVYA